jgi:hypothetical protein
VQRIRLLQQTEKGSASSSGTRQGKKMKNGIFLKGKQKKLTKGKKIKGK